MIHAMLLALCLASTVTSLPAVQEEANTFRPLLHESDLGGWWGCGWEEHQLLGEADSSGMQGRHAEQLAKEWTSKDGVLSTKGSRLRLTSIESFKDFELQMKFKLEEGAYGGVSLRARAMLDFWDTETLSHPSIAFGTLNERGKLYAGYKGSGGLSSNAAWTPGHSPSVIADKPRGEWNDLRLVLVGTRLSLWLNDVLVQDHVEVDNEQGRNSPLPASGHLQLVGYRGEIQWRDIEVREIAHAESLRLFEHAASDDIASISTSALSAWKGPTENWEVVGEALRSSAAGDWMHSAEEADHFTLRLEYEAPAGSGAALLLRAKGSGIEDGVGVEIPLVATGSALSKTTNSFQDQLALRASSAQRPGEWNALAVQLVGESLRVELNGVRVLEGQLPLLGLEGINPKGFIGLKAKGAGLGVRRMSLELHAPAWPSLEPFLAAPFWESVPAFSGVKPGARHTAETVKKAAEMFMTTKSVLDETKKVMAQFGGEPVSESDENPEVHGHPVIPIAMHALAPLWADASWDEDDCALANGAVAILTEHAHGPKLQFSPGAGAKNQRALKTLADWFGNLLGRDADYAAMIYTADDGPFRPVGIDGTQLGNVAERVTIGFDNEVCLLETGPDDEQLIEVRRQGKRVQRFALTKIPGQRRLTFEKVSAPENLGTYGWLVLMRFGRPGDMELMSLYLDAELRPLFYFTGW